MTEARTYLSRAAIHARPTVRPRRRVSLALALLVHVGIAAACTSVAMESWTPARPALHVASSVILEYAVRQPPRAPDTEPAQQVVEVPDEDRASPPLAVAHEPAELTNRPDDAPADVHEAPISDLGRRADLFAGRFSFRFRGDTSEQQPEQKPILAMTENPPVAPSTPTEAGFIRADPVPGRNPAPAYPGSARKRGWEGTVRVRVNIDATGRPVDVVVLASSGRRILDDAVRRTILEKWRFVPARRLDRPVADTWDRSFTFRLGDHRASSIHPPRG